MRATVSGAIGGSFSKVIGINSFPITVAAAAQRPRTAKADIALVLDNTGSMNWDGKLQALKNAVSRPTTGLTARLRTAFFRHGQ